MHCTAVALNIFHSKFEMTASSRPPPIGGFIHFTRGPKSYELFAAENVTLDATLYPHPVSLIATSAPFNFTTMNIFCARSLKSQLMNKKYTSFISCETSCPEEYTLKSRNVSLALTQIAHIYTENWSETLQGDVKVKLREADCFQCPVGAVCNGSIIALPNYWGFANQREFVTMIRCPDGYCCQDKATCKTFNSCNLRRTGTLCDMCAENFTESLFSPDCIASDKCNTNFILLLYFFCTAIYALVLVIFHPLKSKVINILKQLMQLIKGRKTAVDNNQVCDPKTTTTKDSQDTGTKYIQILFYYVQDAALFRVHIPDDDDADEGFLAKVIQFSPDLIASFLTKASNTCFGFDYPAVTKILFKTLFGPSVMMVLFLIYLLHKLLSNHFKKFLEMWNSLKYLLVQAFLLAVLFSFQKMIIGVFSLLQCVTVEDKRVLYIQGNIVCYTWWQQVAKVFLFINILPLLVVFAVIPYYVKCSTISINQFICSCICPIATSLYILVSRLLKHLKTGADYEVSESYNGPPNHELSFIDEDSCSKDGEKESLDKHVQDIELKEQCTEADENKSIDKHVQNIELTDQCTAADLMSDKKENTFKNVIGSSNSCVDAIVQTLLNHYKVLSVCGLKFTWLGIHQLYRVVLVACNTYITEPLNRLWLMTFLLIFVTVINTVIKPYKNNTANLTAFLSYIANILIAIVNVFKTGLATFGCHTNCSLKTMLLWYLKTCENILLIYLPFSVLGCWTLFTGLRKYAFKSKRQ